MNAKRFLNNSLKEVKGRPWMLGKPSEDSVCKVFKAGPYCFIFSDNDRFDCLERWRHLSMSLQSRLPTYHELKSARYTFFPPEAEVVQVFPPESEFVNCHPYCLHLWWSKDRRLVPKETQMAVGPGSKKK